MPVTASTKEKITPSLAHEKDIVFFPNSQEEYETLQKALFAMGFRWSHGGNNIDANPLSLKNGIVLLDSVMYPRSVEDTREYVSASIAQALPGYIPPDEVVIEKLEAVLARLERLEKKVDALQDEILPKDIEKPVLKSPKGMTP